MCYFISPTPVTGSRVSHEHLHSSGTEIPMPRRAYAGLSLRLYPRRRHWTGISVNHNFHVVAIVKSFSTFIQVLHCNRTNLASLSVGVNNAKAPIDELLISDSHFAR